MRGARSCLFRNSMLAAPLIGEAPTPKRTLLEASQQQALLWSTASFISLLNDINAASFGQLLIPAALGLPSTAGGAIFMVATVTSQLVLSLFSGEAYAMGGATIEVIPLLTPIAALAADDALSTSEKASTLLALFSLTSLVVSVMYLAIAKFRLAGIFRCIPLIVLKSALTGVGVFLVLESVKMGVNIADDETPVWQQIAGSAANVVKLATTLGLYLGLVLVQRKTSSPFASLGYLATAVALVGGLRSSRLLVLDHSWYFGEGGGGRGDGGGDDHWAFLGVMPLFSFRSVSVSALLGAVPYALSCAFVHALVTVTDLVALEAASTSAASEAGREPSFNLDREIANIGGANLLSACLGGMPNYMQLTPSMVSLRFTKGVGRAGPYTALLTALSLPALATVVALIPRFVVGAFILDMGVSFIVEIGIETLRHTIDPIDRLLLFLVPTVMVTVEFLPGLATGLVIALCHFVLRYSDLPIVKYQQTAAQLSSNTVRPRAHREVLDRYGHHNITVIALQGFLMFGSTPQLAKALAALVERREQGIKRHPHEPGLHAPPWFVLLDARGCRGCDFGGAREILSMHASVKRKGGELRIMGAPPQVAAAYKAASGGVIGLDHASFEEEMKRAEDAIIATHSIDPSLPDLATLATSDAESEFIRTGFHKTERGDHESVVLALAPHKRTDKAHLMAAATLLALGEIRRVAAGLALWTETNSADFYVLVLSGSLVLSRGSQNHILETVVPGSLIGFLFMMEFMMEADGGVALRDAAFRANEESRVLVISRDLAATIRTEHPALERLLIAAMFARAAAEARTAIRNQVVEDLDQLVRGH